MAIHNLRNCHLTAVFQPIVLQWMAYLLDYKSCALLPANAFISTAIHGNRCAESLLCVVVRLPSDWLLVNHLLRINGSTIYDSRNKNRRFQRSDETRRVARLHDSHSTSYSDCDVLNTVQ